MATEKEEKLMMKRLKDEYKAKIESGELKPDIVQSESLGTYDAGESAYIRDAFADYAYNKPLDPTNVDWQDMDSFHNNPIDRDMAGGATYSIDSKTTIYNESTNRSADDTVNMFQGDYESKTYYSPKQIDYIRKNQEVLGLSSEDMQRIETGAGGSSMMYQQNDGQRVLAFNSPTGHMGEITTDGKTWQHSTPMELKKRMEDFNASIINDDTLSPAEKRAKLEMARKDHIRKFRSGEYKQTSGRQIYEEQFKPTAITTRNQLRDSFNQTVNQRTNRNFMNNPPPSI
tara:strand:+ start:2105 stop:2962 length:858 start_codon:yes stop_codon:yes gene_type:complete